MNAICSLAAFGYIFIVILSSASATYVWDGSKYVACKCNRRASRCEWDPTLYRNTGSGTRCLYCIDNTEGLHCEKCIANHYRQTTGGRCQPCGCNTMGSSGSSCDDRGRCRCKAEGVIGDKCDQCQPGFYALSSSGCKRCMCNMAGTRDMCHTETGQCNCKYNVEGTNCNYCKSGHFNLDAENPMGCSACFCYGHSSVCKADSGYSKDCITSAFGSGTEGWKAQHRNGHDLPLRRSSSSQDIIIEAKDQYPVYFIAPAKFTGNRVLSYGQNLSFTFYVERNKLHPSVEDLILEGETQTLSAPITVQNNPLPNTKKQTYNFRLHEALMYGWKPFLTSKDFQRVLAGLKAIKIRGSYKPQCRGHLDDVVLRTAQAGAGQRPAEWVERCTCPVGYEGRFCEQCATGYTRHRPELGPYSECIPCNCNGHSACDPETGSCYSSDVAPVTCPNGFYTDPDNLSSCVKCPCPNRASCTVSPGTRDVVCTNCPEKTMGSRCEMCEEGYFGKPLAGRRCQPCMCNGNTDPNSVGNCDQDTGECLKCLYGTTGPHCERCKDGFLGNALNSQPSEKCNLCSCDPRGSWSTQCRGDGACDCRPGMFGPRCDQCAGDRYYNSTTGCQECPSCYQVVLNKVAKHQITVRELEILISKVSGDPDSVTDKQFEERLRKASQGVSEMVLTAGDVKVDDEKNVRSLNTINRQLSSNSAHLEGIKRTVDETRRSSTTYDDQVRRTDRLLTQIRTEIQKARTEMTHIPALPDISGGDNNMVRLADEARRLADMHKREADDIESLSGSADNLSSSALQLIREVLDKDRKVTQSINQLEKQFNENKDMVKDLEEQADRINTKSQKSSDRATQIFNELKNLPLIDITSLTEKADRLEIKQTGITLDLNRNFQDYERQQNKLYEYQENVRKLLEKGKIDQTTADMLLARAKAARDLADAAVINGGATLEEIDRLLNNLNVAGFNGRVLENKTAAEDALRKIPGISRIIDQANSKTKQAQDTLGNAVNTANVAKENAKAADSMADKVLKNAVKALDDATNALNDANSLTNDMINMEGQLRGIETGVEDKQKLVDRDTKNAHQTTEAVDKAIGNTANAKDAVSNAKDVINQMLLSLDNPIPINEDRLIAVEETLEHAKKQLNNGLKLKVRELEQAATSQSDTIAAFDKDIKDILGDIKNLEDIINTLPTGCFNVADIENQ